MGLGLGLGLDKPKGLIYFQNQFSMYFDGSDDRIFTDADAVAQPTTYSFCCKSSETGENKGVFGHGGENIAAFHFNWIDSGLTRPLLYLGGNYYRFWNDTTAQDDGEWHHWVVYSDTNDITNSKLYVDGVLQTASATVSSGSTTAYAESLTIGSDRQVGGNSFLGSMDEFAVFDRELTQAEITRMYNTYYTNNLVKNGNFEEIGGDVVQNGKFEQIGGEEVTNGTFDLGDDLVENGSFSQIGNEEVDNSSFSQTGSDLASGYDFTSGWNEFGAGTEITDSTSFISQSGQGIYAGLGLVANKTYKIKIAGTQPSGGYFSIKAGTTGTSFGNISGRSFDETIYATPTVVTGVGNDFYIRLSTHPAGTTITISSLEVEEVGQDWTFENGAAMGDDVATIIGDGSVAGYIIQDNVFESNKIYKCVFDVTINSGLGLKFQDGLAYSPHNSNIGFATTSGVYTFYFNSTSYNQLVIMRRTGGTAYDSIINSVSVKEVGQEWTLNDSCFFTPIGINIKNTPSVGILTASGSPLLTIGSQYKMTYEITENNDGEIKLAAAVDEAMVSTVGTHTKYFTADQGSIRFIREGSVVDVTIDNISIQETNWEVTKSTISDGEATITSTDGSYAGIKQTGVFDVDKSYFYSFNVKSISGTGQFRAGTNGVDFTTNGLITGYVKAAGSQTLEIKRIGGAFSAIIDNVSVKEVGQNWTLQNGWSMGDDIAIFNGSVSAYRKLFQENIITIGEQYKLTFEIKSISSGSIANLEPNSPSFDTIGVKTQYFTATYDDLFLEPTNDAVLTIDNISVQEVGQNWILQNGSTIIEGAGNVIANGDLGSTGANWSLHQDVGMIGGRSYNISFSARRTGGTGNFQVAQAYLKGFDQNITSSFENYSFNIIPNNYGGNTGYITLGGLTVGDTFEVDNIVVQQLKHQATNLLVNSGDYQSANPLLTSTKSMYFDGIDEYLIVNEGYDYNNRTFATWFNSADNTKTSNYPNTILSQNDSSGGNRWHIRIDDTDNQVKIYDGAIIILSGNINTTTIEENRWYNVVMTEDGTTLKFYINGIIQGSG